MGKAKPNTAPSVSETANNVTSIADRKRTKETAPATAERGGSEPATPSKDAALVVFGRDESGKAHASWFGEVDVELAKKAAGLMGYLVLPITSDEHRAAALALPAGRIFASGKGFCRFAKMPLTRRCKRFLRLSSHQRRSSPRPRRCLRLRTRRRPGKA